MKDIDRDGSEDEHGIWRDQGRQRFEAAYAPEDTIYDQLIGTLAENCPSQ